MKKRLAVLLIVAVVLAAAPVALADHCRTCRNLKCSFATTGGYLSCTQLANGCSLSGSCGGPHPFTEEVEYFTTEFEVVAVERLDETPQPAATTRVASADTVREEVRR